MAYGAPGGGVPAPPPPAAALKASLHHPRLGQAPLLRHVRHGRSAGGTGNVYQFYRTFLWLVNCAFALQSINVLKYTKRYFRTQCILEAAHIVVKTLVDPRSKWFTSKTQTWIILHKFQAPAGGCIIVVKSLNSFWIYYQPDYFLCSLKNSEGFWLKLIFKIWA